MGVTSNWHKGALVVLTSALILGAMIKNNKSVKEPKLLPQTQELLRRLPNRNITTRICLNMIANNEANKMLIPSLHAAALHLTGYMFCDTGSTDKTPQLAKAFFDLFNISGMVVQHEWKDFSHNRNLCLEEGRRLLGDVCDYFLILDADQIMVSEDGIILVELDLTEPGYWLRESCHGTLFSNKRLISTKYKWKYYGRVHEYIAPGNDDLEVDLEAEVTGTLPDSISSIHDSDFSRGFDRDANLLESEIEQNPNDSRSRYYLGNTYRALNRRQDAIVQWAARTSLGDWEEEVYMSALGIGNILEEIYKKEDNETLIRPEVWAAMVTAGIAEEKPEEERIDGKNNVTLSDVITAYETAHRILPYLQEAPYYLARLSRQQLEDTESCTSFAQAALAGGPANDNSLFVNRHIYRFLVLDELCTCAFYVPEKASVGLKACDDLVQNLEKEGARSTESPEWAQALLKRTEDSRTWYLKAHRNKREDEGGPLASAW